MKLIFAVLYVPLNDGPYRQTTIFYIYICSFSTSIHSHDINFRFSKQMPAKRNYTSGFDFLALLSSSACDSAYKFYPN